MRDADQERRWAFMKVHHIMDREQPDKILFTRLRIVQTPLFGLLFHIYRRKDTGALHDHPFAFWTLIVRGGYDESWTPFDGGWPRLRSWRPGSIHRVKLTDWHKIERLYRETSWTLLLVGARRQQWGFWVDGEKVHHDEYVDSSENVRLG